MKVELQCGDTITIPEGCKAIIKDGSVVFEKDQEFKDGDILCSENGTMVIFKEKEVDGSEWFYSYYSTNSSCIGCWFSSAFHHATEEEKQQLFAEMKEDGLRWNTEEKRVENIRWRAEKGNDYYFIDRFCYLGQDREDFHLMDDRVYNSFNYFRTEEQAREAARRVKEVLRKFHEEIGE